MCWSLLLLLFVVVLTERACFRPLSCTPGKQVGRTELIKDNLNPKVRAGSRGADAAPRSVSRTHATSNADVALLKFVKSVN